MQAASVAGFSWREWQSKWKQGSAPVAHVRSLLRLPAADSASK